MRTLLNTRRNLDSWIAQVFNHLPLFRIPLTSADSNLLPSSLYSVNRIQQGRNGANESRLQDAHDGR